MSEPRLHSVSLRRLLPRSLSPLRVQSGQNLSDPTMVAPGNPSVVMHSLSWNPEQTVFAGTQSTEENVMDPPAFLRGKGETGVPQPGDREAGCGVAVISSHRPLEKSISTSAGKGRIKRGEEREKAVTYPTAQPHCQAAEHKEVPFPALCPTRPREIRFPSPRAALAWTCLLPGDQSKFAT